MPAPNRLEGKEDEILGMIYAGDMLAAIAAKFGVDRANLGKWIEADKLRSARAREARIAAAAAWDEKAEQAIAEASDPFELAKAREIAQHYRWRSSKISPQYSDKQQVEHSGEITVNGLAARMRQKRSADSK